MALSTAKKDAPQVEPVPETWKLKALVTGMMPHSRMNGSEFEWPAGEEVDRWIANGMCERIGGDDFEETKIPPDKVTEDSPVTLTPPFTAQSVPAEFKPA